MSRAERDRWERKWATRSAPDFPCYRSHIEPPLVDFVRSLDATRGLALDIGCGAGTTTRFLAEHFRGAIGLDHSHSAVAQARSMQSESTTYCVADVLALPVADGAVSMVLDRSCSQFLSEEQNERLLDEIARVLEPGGHYAVVSRVGHSCRPGPPVVRQLWRLRSWLGARLRREQTLTHRRLRARFPESLSVQLVTQVRQRSDSGRHQRHLLAVALRRD